MSHNLPPSFQVTSNAAKRISYLAEKKSLAQPRLRIQVEGGGCSGFQYQFEFDQSIDSDDQIFTCDNVEVVVDPMSLELMSGGSLDYVQDLGKAYFHISNPLASAQCGCGNSFAVK